MECFQLRLMNKVKNGEPWQIKLILCLILTRTLRPKALHDVFAEKLLYKAISDRYMRKVPLTYDKGCHPTDGIFLSLTLHISKNGYLPFSQQVSSNFRGIWVDFSYWDRFGYNLPEIVRTKMHWLKCSDQRIVSPFNTKYERFLRQQNIYCSYPLTPVKAEEYKRINRLKWRGSNLQSRCANK